MWCHDWTRDSLEGQMEQCWDTALAAGALAGVLCCFRVRPSLSDSQGVGLRWGLFLLKTKTKQDSQTSLYGCMYADCVCVCVGAVLTSSVKWLLVGGVGE